jgi:hypothetical protein
MLKWFQASQSVTSCACRPIVVGNSPASLGRSATGLSGFASRMSGWTLQVARIDTSALDQLDRERGCDDCCGQVGKCLGRGPPASCARRRHPEWSADSRIKAACAELVTKCQFLNKYGLPLHRTRIPRALTNVCSESRGSYPQAAPARALSLRHRALCNCVCLSAGNQVGRHRSWNRSPTPRVACPSSTVRGPTHAHAEHHSCRGRRGRCCIFGFRAIAGPASAC